jgi:GT2 family glycosyltransferase
LYADAEIEIIIVDDGSPDPAQVEGQFPWPVQLIRLSAKEEAKNPCLAFNVGVQVATHDHIVLTNPEIVHRAPILSGMSAALSELGPKGYVAAACWDITHKWWFCHSTDEPPDAKVGRAPKPKGAGFHFCSMLHRSLYDEIGGFSDEYRDGQGYEDNDLLWKLERAGAKFKICDELVTDHHPCPRTEWPKGGAERNRAIFEAKWNG